MNNNKKCELCCKKRARMYCESDQASLCFDCDSKVHSANFLVAKHTRNLLCHSCQNPTPWSSSGPKVPPTLSVCISCIEIPPAGAARNAEIARSRERVEENYETEIDEEDEYGSSESEINDHDDDDDDDDGEEDDGNQVVPLSSSPSSTFSSGSYGDLSAAGDGGGATVVAGCPSFSSSSPWKRLRESDCLHFEISRITTT